MQGFNKGYPGHWLLAASLKVFIAVICSILIPIVENRVMNLWYQFNKNNCLEWSAVYYSELLKSRNFSIKWWIVFSWTSMWPRILQMATTKLRTNNGSRCLLLLGMMENLWSSILFATENNVSQYTPTYSLTFRPFIGVNGQVPSPNLIVWKNQTIVTESSQLQNTDSLFTGMSCSSTIRTLWMESTTSHSLQSIHRILFATYSWWDYLVPTGIALTLESSDQMACLEALTVIESKALEAQI